MAFERCKKKIIFETNEKLFSSKNVTVLLLRRSIDKFYCSVFPFTFQLNTQYLFIQTSIQIHSLALLLSQSQITFAIFNCIASESVGLLCESFLKASLDNDADFK